MMAMFIVYTIALFWFGSVSSADTGIGISNNLIVSPPAVHCTNASGCPVSRNCYFCIIGRGPPCTQATCIKGECGTIKPCSQNISTTVVSRSCTTGNQCPHSELCRECDPGYGPTCAGASCIHGRCAEIAPCSQKSKSTTPKTPPQCSKMNTSQCIIHRVCALCLQGRTPFCTGAACEHGQCKIIEPCSMNISSSDTSVGCQKDDQCFHALYCDVKCPNGTGPVCASSKCVHGKCVPIAPCSQISCKTRATCPYQKRNCVPCPEGYGPGCEQPVCSSNICSIVSPCSKKLPGCAIETTKNK